MKEITGKTKLFYDCFPRNLVINNTKVTSKKNMAMKFNNFFINIGPKHASHRPF